MIAWQTLADSKVFVGLRFFSQRLFGFDSIFHAITFPLDDDRFAMMEEAVEDGGGEGGIIVEDGRPLFEGFIGCDADGTALVAFTDDLEQQIGSGFIDGHIAKFIDSEKLRFEEGLDFGFESVGVLGGQERIDQINGGDPADGIAFLTGLMTQGEGQMGFAKADAAEEKDIAVLR